MPPLRERLPSLGPKSLAVAAIASVLIVHWLGVPLLDRTELSTYDLRFHWRGEVPPAPEVVLAAVDEKSLDALGRWPWSRTRMAELVDALSGSGARVIAFDIGFLEPESAQADGALASAIARSPADVVLGYFFHDPKEAGAHATDPDALEGALEPISFTALTVRSRESDPDALPLHPGDLPETNLPEITAAAEGAGYFNIKPDDDGVVRRTPLVMGVGMDAYPSLALEAAWYARGRPPLVVEVVHDRVAGISLGEEMLPTDGFGEALLSYAGPAGTIPHVPVADILSGAASEDALRNRIVIVGVTANGVFDLRATPFAPVYPGAEVQATALDNILRNRFITRPGWANLADQIAIVLLGAVTALAVSRLGPVSELLAALAIAAAYAGLAVRLFANGIWIDLVHPLLAVGITYTSLSVRAFFVEQRERARITGMFGQYVSPIVVEQMRAHPEQLRLGGEERVAGALLDGLLGEAAVLGGGLDLLGLVADDDDDVLDAGEAEVAEDEVEDGPAEDFVEHLGALRLHADALPGGEHDGLDVVQRHGEPHGVSRRIYGPRRGKRPSETSTPAQASVYNRSARGQFIGRGGASQAKTKRARSTLTIAPVHRSPWRRRNQPAKQLDHIRRGVGLPSQSVGPEGFEPSRSSRSTNLASWLRLPVPPRAHRVSWIPVAR